MPEPACQVTPVKVISLPPGPTPRQVMRCETWRISDVHDYAYDRRTFVEFDPEAARCFDPDPRDEH